MQEGWSESRQLEKFQHELFKRNAFLNNETESGSSKGINNNEVDSIDKIFLFVLIVLMIFLIAVCGVMCYVIYLKWFKKRKRKKGHSTYSTSSKTLTKSSRSPDKENRHYRHHHKPSEKLDKSPKMHAENKKRIPEKNAKPIQKGKVKKLPTESVPNEKPPPTISEFDVTALNLSKKVDR